MMLAEEPGHEQINIKVDHVLFGVSEYGAHIFGDVFDLAPLIDQVNEYGPKLRTEDVDLFLVEDSFFEHLVIVDLLQFSLIALVHLNIVVKKMNQHRHL